jgi:hypothetical protein
MSRLECGGQERAARVERRLSAILAADVAGYSRLMHTDEEATRAKLTALLTDAVAPAIAEHGGRTVKKTGDGFLAEFPSAVEAVRAAIQFHTRIKELTADDPDARRIAFRVGINIGDVPSRTISLATASILRRGSRASQSPAASAYLPQPMIKSEARLGFSSPIWGSRTSKISQSRSEPMLLSSPISCRLSRS